MRIRAKDMLKKYPELWATVESSVWDDLINCAGELSPQVRRRLAYNAAFVAASEHHKEIRCH